MEINPRIQVEHGVTEAVTGINFVRTQIRIANSGESLDLQQEDVKFNKVMLSNVVSMLKTQIITSCHLQEKN